MFVNSDFSDLLRLFNDNGVRYLVIGGYAVIQYAEPRYTKDLDLWISADKDNAAAVYKALKEFGAPLAGLAEEDFYQVGIHPIRVDILMGIPGLEFDSAWQHRVEVDFDDFVVGVCIPRGSDPVRRVRSLERTALRKLLYNFHMPNYCHSYLNWGA